MICLVELQLTYIHVVKSLSEQVDSFQKRCELPNADSTEKCTKYLSLMHVGAIGLFLFLAMTGTA